jgi:chemotaxis signal transduction protein
MDLSPSLLYCQVLPLANQRLLVPYGAVVEIIPLSTGMDALSPPFDMAWREGTLPVLCFESLYGDDLPQPGPRTRVAVLRLPHAGQATHVGILIQGYPQMVPVTPDQARPLPLTEKDRQAPVLFRVNFARSEMLIPDLECMARLLDQPADPAAASDQVAPAGLQDSDGSERGGLGAQDAGAEPERLEAVFAGKDLLAEIEPAFWADEERD